MKRKLVAVIAAVAGFLLLVLASIAASTGLRGCSIANLMPTPTPTPAPTSTPTPSPGPSEEEVSDYPAEVLHAKYGQSPVEFKNSSTKFVLQERVDATGFADGVTYGVKPAIDPTSDRPLEGIVEEILSNPVYLTGVDQALREVGFIGNSTWSQEFLESYDPFTTEWWCKWIEKGPDGKWYVTEEYFLIAARYACIIEGLSYYAEVDKTDVIAHWPLDPEREICIRSEQGEDYPFWVFRLLFKDGREVFIGINEKDWRWAVLPPVPTPTPTGTPTPTPSEDEPTPTPSEDEPTPTPTSAVKNREDDVINRNSDPTVAADIGSPDNPENHDNITVETPEPTSPPTYTNVATPTPTSAPTPTTATTTTTTTTEAPSVEPVLSGDGTISGEAPTGDPG